RDFAHAHDRNLAGGVVDVERSRPGRLLSASLASMMAFARFQLLAMALLAASSAARHYEAEAQNFPMSRVRPPGTRLDVEPPTYLDADTLLLGGRLFVAIDPIESEETRMADSEGTRMADSEGTRMAGSEGTRMVGSGGPGGDAQQGLGGY
ncbi:hypothetical protein T492DRAFT_72236, partial [Pavlovales sp. CCMP2436]